MDFACIEREMAWYNKAKQCKMKKEKKNILAEKKNKSKRVQIAGGVLVEIN